MSKKRKPILFTFVALGIIMLAVMLFWGTNVAVFNPQGPIAREQLDLIIVTSLLSLIVVLPVFALTFYIVWKYRATNTSGKKAPYRPDWDRHRGIEAVWWLVPFVLIGILSVVIWKSSHDLDPYKPLASDKKPVTVQVIALDWKWLFIYPEQNIASVNHVQFPVDTPVNFRLTADAPMNSFWIPQLGGQVYAMAGMQTKLHLMADKIGSYQGSSANISGEGFAGMTFTAKASSQKDFDAWVRSVKKAEDRLDAQSYEALAKPGKNHPVTYYASSEKGLYDTVIMKYMVPKDTQEGEQARTRASTER